ncbi:preprotein translocase subunit SecD [Thermosyntropha lipolytica DSM 11003]|uniref:Protein translocase subunit SecD n=1 Tax=Thermosyntropha lipolytica DSM 11003 TaxID=1123382 RepID=A0A1M5P9E2_9FIRM|nr:protein translocase subunit SecD [Thermosyntropha lipolytica]SHG98315.1 preprotein translocase subunit SecD [Thermosyntropha lipolytica DSM 11003]
MKKTSSILIIAVIIAALAFLTYYLYEPIKENIKLGLDLRGGLRVVLEAEETEGQEVTPDTIQKALGILRNRVDSLGVKETNLFPQGDRRIVIEIAGEEDPEAAVDLLKTTSQLEFWDEQGNVLLTGKNLKDAQATVDPQRGAMVQLEFDKEGTKLFAKATQENLGRRIAIVIDNNVVSAPVVRDVITTGQAVIEGDFTAKEAQDLAVLLRSGALPVSFKVMEKRSIGPTLGADSLEKSIKAGIVGIIAVLIFMLGYYRLPGLIADISLILYALLVLGTMWALGAVLTLPGIAAFALSIGMAVDANIIIYERIKEELRLGKTLLAAIEAGFRRAFRTILDANITTLITALVLMYFGTGPIKGFAVTLSIGIVASMLVALIFTRYMLILFANITKNTKLYGV